MSGEAHPTKHPSRRREGTKKLPSRLREGLGEGLSKLPEPHQRNPTPPTVPTILGVAAIPA